MEHAKIFYSYHDEIKKTTVMAGTLSTVAKINLYISSKYAIIKLKKKGMNIVEDRLKRIRDFTDEEHLAIIRRAEEVGYQKTEWCNTSFDNINYSEI